MQKNSYVLRDGERTGKASAPDRMRSIYEFGPTFIGIGSMRCGSTWLYNVLRRHPEIRLSDCKEVDFFFMNNMLLNDLNWYTDLFRPAEGEGVRPVRGEISPRYARLKAWHVNRIAASMPHLKILLTLRHPLQRVWSQTVYDFGHLAGKDVAKVTVWQFMRQLERARSRLSSDYYRMIKIWSDAFGKSAVHIDFFDRLESEPNDFVNGVLRHIGASNPWQVPGEFIKKRVWATSSLVEGNREMPDVVRWYVADQLLKPTERLNDLLEGRVSHWVDELKTLTHGSRLSWRVMKDVNKAVLTLPERVAFHGYDALRDVRLWNRWNTLAKTQSGLEGK